MARLRRYDEFTEAELAGFIEGLTTVYREWEEDINSKLAKAKQLPDVTVGVKAEARTLAFIQRMKESDAKSPTMRMRVG